MTKVLEFTGNWFIDAGILGFVNLMEEVYGDVWKKEWKEKNPNEAEWKFNFLEYLKKKIKENEKLVYYGFFPLAYFIKWLKDRKYEIDDVVIKNFLVDIKKIETLEKQQIFEKIWWRHIVKLFKNLYIENKLNSLKNWISKNENKKKWKKCEYSELKIGIKKLTKEEIELLKKFIDKDGTIDENKFKEVMNKKFAQIIKEENIEKNLSLFFRLPIDSSFYKNFLFFNTSAGILAQKDNFLDLLNSSSKKEVLNKIDKVINKLLPSEDEFHNIFYCPTLIENLKENIPYLFVYLICFTFAFEKFKNIGNILFYSNDLKFTYLINKRLKLKKKKIEKKENKNSNAIFRVAWNEIVDTLIEYKSEWSLENMYIIKYQRLDNQSQEGVEYIGIPKLQAQVLLDDHIRNALNQWVIIHKAGENIINKWILEEFISGKPLYPLVFQHIRTCLTNNFNVNYFVFYSLLLDASILELKEEQRKDKSKTLFSNEFFKRNYKEIVQKVKRGFSIAYYYTTQVIPKYFEDYDERKRFAYSLLNALQSKDKAEFLYILFKKLNEKKIINTPVLNWIFDKIINNDISWKEYGLLLVGGLVYKHE